MTMEAMTVVLYSPVCKCRMCGEIFSGSSCYDANAIFSVRPEQSAIDRERECVHIHDDGTFGVADIIGFKREWNG